MGATATKRTTIPMPPVHWAMLRQSSTEGATSSGTRIVEAPVVVKPAMDSKKASTGPMSPEKTNGNEPTDATPNQPRTTMRNTSCLKMRGSGLRVSRKRMAPRAIAPDAGSPKARVLPSPTASEKAAGISMAAPPAAIIAPSALAITLGCKEALYLVHGFFDGEDDRVVPRPEHLLAGGDNDLAVPQQGPDDGSFRETYLREWPAGDRAPLRDPKLYHLSTLLQEGHVYDLALSHEPEYGFGGQLSGRDRQVHAQGVGQGRELPAAHARDGYTGSKLAGVHRGEKVRPVVAGDGDECVGPVYALLQQKVSGEAVSVEHEPLLELRGHVAGPDLVPLDDLHRHADSLEGLSQPQPDAPAPVDRHVLDRRSVGSHHIHHLGDALPAGDEQDVIPVFQHRISPGHKYLPTPHHPDHEALLGEPHVPERPAHGRGRLIQNHLRDLYFASGEGVHVYRPRHEQGILDLFRRHLLGVDDEIDPQYVSRERLLRIVVVRVVEAGHGARHSLGLRRQARDNVHLVGCRRGYQQLGFLDPGLRQYLGARPVAVDHQGVELLGQPFHQHLVLLDEYDIMPFSREQPGCVGADLSGPDYYRSHCRFLSAARGVTVPRRIQ